MSTLQNVSDSITKYKLSTLELRKFSEFLKQNSKTKLSDFSTFHSVEVNDQILNKELNELLEESKKWKVQIRSFVILDNRLTLKLLRSTFLKSVFIDVADSKSSYQSSNPFNGKVYKICCEECRGMTQLRLSKAAEVISALIVVGGGTVTSRDVEEGKVKTIHLSHRRSSSASILVSSVKLSDDKVLSEDDLVRLRTEDMRALSDHKHLDDTSLDQLVRASIVFDLLSVKLNKPVCLESSPQPKSATRQSNSKGAPFVLYNYVRLHTILERYNYGVANGSYPPLADVHDINYSLLSSEDEWSLVFDLIAEWPAVLAESQDLSRPRLHRLTGFLSALASTFSIYYRHTRVLTEGLPHMLPLIEARIHLLITIKEVCLSAFYLLGISPPHKM